MALNSIIRRSASTVAPLAARLLGGQRTFNHHAGGALFTAVNHIISNNSFLVPSASRFSYSASPALKRPTSEIKCSEESIEEGEEVQKFKSSFGGPKSDGSNENRQKVDFRKTNPMTYTSSVYRTLKAVVFYGPSIESSPVQPLLGKIIH